MIDRALITRKLLLIGKDLEALRVLGAKSATDYLASETDELLAERRLERLIGRMIDVNFHVITETGGPPPPDYFQSFLELAALGVLTRELAGRLAPAAGLRNRIAHEYDDIDPAKVYDALQDALRDVPEYLDAILACLDRAGT